MFFFDWTYLLLIPGFLLAVWAQNKVQSTFRAYAEEPAASGLTGADVARRMLQRADLVADTERADPTKGVSAVEQLRAVAVEPIEGQLTDHFDPRDNTLRLSEPVYHGRSIAALGVAAHEAGHAMQYATRYGPMGLRAAIVPVASLGSNLAMPVFMIGLMMAWFAQGAGPLAKLLMDAGILLFSGAVVFSLVTLPVELNASRRALLVLDRGGFLNQDELPGARAVLSAAAWTYVAATAVAVLSLVRLLLLRSQMDRD